MLQRTCSDQKSQSSLPVTKYILKIWQILSRLTNIQNLALENAEWIATYTRITEFFSFMWTFKGHSPISHTSSKILTQQHNKKQNWVQQHSKIKTISKYYRLIDIYGICVSSLERNPLKFFFQMWFLGNSLRTAHSDV